MQTGEKARVLITLFLLGIVATTAMGQTFVNSGGLSANPQENVISTVAGTGGMGFNGDGSPGTSVQLYRPFGLAVDSEGNLYFADKNNHRIRKLTVSGEIITVAGGEYGFSGDGGDATQARLDSPGDVAIDRVGNLLIADSGNHRIRKVNPDGIITTFAGNGQFGFSGDGGPANQAMLNSPSGIAEDAAGNIYIADTGNHRIRMVNTSGIISTVAGSGAEGFKGDGGPAILAKLFWPRDIAFDQAGNIYIADSGNNRVRKIDSAGVIRTFAGNGTKSPAEDSVPAVSTAVAEPTSLAFDGSGNLFIGEYSGNRIRRVDSTGIATSVVGGSNNIGLSGEGVPAILTGVRPNGLAFDVSGNLYISDTDASRIRRVNRSVSVTPVVTSISITSGLQDSTLSATLTGYNLQSANAVIFNGSGVYATISGSATSTTLPITILITANAAAGLRTLNVTTPNGVSASFSGFTVTLPPLTSNGPPAIDRTIDGRLRISRLSAQQGKSVSAIITGTNLANASAVTFSGSGVTAKVLSGGSDTSLPVFITVDSTAFIGTGVRNVTITTPLGTSAPASGFFLIAGSGTARVITTVVGQEFGSLSGAIGITTDKAGNLYVADRYSPYVRKVTPFATMSTLGVAFAYPAGVAVDSAGNLFVLDGYHVSKVTPSGDATIIAINYSGVSSGDGGPLTSAQFGQILAIAVDSADRLLIVDNSRVRRVDSNGIINTIAGSTTGFSGDGGPATSARLGSNIRSLTTDATGNIFIADTNNNRIRKITPDGLIDTVAGNGNIGSSGDGGPATSAQISISYMPGVAADRFGNLYIIDAGRIRMVNPAGVINTIAGNGDSFDGRDDIAAIIPGIGQPQGIAVDEIGNVFFTDGAHVRQIVAQATPSISSITSSSGLQNTTLSATISGTDLTGATGVLFSGTGVRATIGAGDTNSTIPILITIDPEAALGERTVTVTTERNISSAFGGFTVGASTQPNISSLSVTSGLRGSTFSTAVRGQHLDGATAVTFSGSGVTAILSGGGTDTNLPVAITLAPNAQIGLRSLKVTTSAGISADFIGFTVLPSVPSISSMSVRVGKQGATVASTITGSNLGDVTTVVFSGNGVTASIIPNGRTNTELPISITIAADAAVNTRTVVLGTPDRLSSPFNGFEVAVNGPFLSRVNPASGLRNSTISAVIIGANLSGATAVTFSGTGITATLSPGTETTLPISIAIAKDTSVTARTVTVTTASGTAELVNGFSVLSGSTGRVSSISPATGAQGSAFTATISGTNLSGANGISFGGGGISATISSVSSTSVRISGTISTNATTGIHNFVISTPAGNTDAFNGFSVVSAPRQSIITTIAGTGVQGFSGDLGFAQVNRPIGVATDSAGNVYIADTDNDRVRKLTPLGVITTVAGNGQHGVDFCDICGFSGEGGPATSARLYSPQGVAIDPQGNLYIADSGNARIRKVDSSGIITTVVGNGLTGFGGDGNIATAARLNGPTGITFDSSGNLYIADTGNHRVRKVDVDGIIRTIAGNGGNAFAGDGGPAIDAQLYYPTGVAVDANRNVFIADFYHHRIRKINAAGFISTFAGTGVPGWSGDGGSAESAKLQYPFGVALDSAGSVLISDYFNDRIRKVTSGVITTVAGNGASGFGGDGGVATSALLFGPLGIAVDRNDNLFIADNLNNLIRVVAAGKIFTVAGTGVAGFNEDGGLATTARLNFPQGVASDASGRLFVADYQNSRIRIVLTNGTIISLVGVAFNANGVPELTSTFPYVRDIAFDGVGNMYIAESGRIRRINSAGVISTLAGAGASAPGYSGDGGPASLAQVNPTSIAVDLAGNVVFADTDNQRIRMINRAGIISTIAGTGTAGFAGDGDVATAAKLNGPNGIAFDSSGNLYIAEYWNNRVRVVNPSGVITTFAGTGVADFGGDDEPATLGQLNHPTDVAVDNAGNVFIMDSQNYRVRMVAPSGIITTVVGRSPGGFGGDGGPATSALISGAGLTTDGSGNLLIADSGNHRIRKVTFTSPPNQPTITGISPPFADQGASISASIFGAVLSGATAVTFSGTGVTAVIGDSRPPNTLPLTIAVSASAASGLRTITVATTEGTVSFSGFGVRESVRQPIVIGISRVTGTTGTIISATIYGESLSGATAITFSGAGVTATIDATTPTTLSLTISVSSNAATTLRTFTVTTPAGVSPAFNGFTIITPVITGISPSSGLAGMMISGTISGTNLSGAIAVVFGGTGVTATVGNGGTATSVPFTVRIDADAALGLRSFAVVTTETISQSFPGLTVNAAGTSGTITTVAGNGTDALTPDGALATSSGMYFPTGVATTTAGGFYFADRNHWRIRKVNSDGVISTVAGTGLGGYGGDGGPAISAKFSSGLAGIALDAAGNLYITDGGNQRVRKVDTNGIVTTFAGNGYDGSTGDNGPATSATLNNPTGVAVDANGNVFIAEAYGNRIRKVDPTGIITTFAGTGSSGFSGDGGNAKLATLNSPTDLAVDTSGNLFISDGGNRRVRRVTPNGTINTVAGNGFDSFSGDGGPALSAAISRPKGLATDTNGNLYIIDQINNRVRKLTPDGLINTIAGGGNPYGDLGDGGPALAASLNLPDSIAVDQFGNILISDFAHNRIRKVTFFPKATGISPSSSKQGTSLSAIVSGANLLGVTSVTVRGVGITATIETGGTASTLNLTISIAADAPTGVRTFVLNRPDGVSTALGFNVIPTTPPTISTIIPTVGAKSTNVSAVINGTHLNGATAVSFGGTGVTAAILNGGTETILPILITIASDAEATLRTVTVTATGSPSTAFSGFNIVPLLTPAVDDFSAAPSGLSQAVAPYFGRSFTLRVRGRNFQTGTVVSMDGIELATSVVSSTELNADVTAAMLSTLGSRNVKAINPGNMVSNVLNLNVAARGDVNANGVVNIGDALVTALIVGGLASPELPLAFGDVNLTGTVNIGDALTIARFAGGIDPDWSVPTVTSVSNQQPSPGSTLTISGAGFAPTVSDNQVSFSTASGIRRIAPASASAQSLTVTIPDDAVSGFVQVIRRDTPLAGRPFTLAISGTPIALTLRDVTPGFQVERGGTLSLTGLGFDSTPNNNLVLFKSQNGPIGATVLAATSTSLVVTIPSEATCGPVSVTRAGQTSNQRLVVITGTECNLQLTGLIAPAAPGDTVALEGTGFDTVNPSNNVVRFAGPNGETIIAPVLASGTKLLQVHVPEQAVNGDITVTVNGVASNAIFYHAQ